MRRFLMISPFFVPMNYVGAKRALHFARHLPSCDWEPAVIALPEDIERDPALAPLVPDVPMLRAFRSGPVAAIEDMGLRMRRAAARPKPNGASRAKPPRSRKAGLLSSAFDRWTRYQPHVIVRALAFLKRERCELVYANAGPFSALELGAALARITGLPFVADLRDPWSIEPNYRADRSPLAQKIVAWREQSCFDRAGRIVLNTESALVAYRDVYRDRIPAERFLCIRNSFDPDLYGPLPPPPGPKGPFHIVYYGDLRPSKDAVLFLEALRAFVARHRIEPGEMVFTTLGKRTAQDEAAIAELGLAEYVASHDWLPFTRCRELLGTADLLLDLMGPNHGLQISGKFYDYLACKRPILCISPNTEMDAILAATHAGRRVGNDMEAIAAALETALKAKRQKTSTAPEEQAVMPFTALPAAQALAHVFDEVIR